MLDNKGNGKVCDELTANIQAGSKLSVISAYFTIYTFNELRKELGKIESMFNRKVQLNVKIKNLIV